MGVKIYAEILTIPDRFIALRCHFGLHKGRAVCVENRGSALESLHCNIYHKILWNDYGALRLCLLLLYTEDKNRAEAPQDY